jgi:hypothetical protein
MQTIKLIQGCPDPIFSPVSILSQNLNIKMGTVFGRNPWDLHRQLVFLDPEGQITDYASYQREIKTQGYVSYNPFKSPEELEAAQLISKLIKDSLSWIETKNNIITKGVSLGFYSGNRWVDEINLFFLPEDLEKDAPLIFNYYAQQQMMGYSGVRLLELIQIIYSDFLESEVPLEVKTLKLQGLREYIYKLLKNQFIQFAA